MNQVFRECAECYGYKEMFSNCCDAEVDNNKCSDCGKFCESHSCDSCNGEGGDYLNIGDYGTMVTNVSTNDEKFSKDQIVLIKKKGSRVKDGMYPNYYHNDVKIVTIIDELNLEVVIGEYGRKRFKISIDDFYL